MSARHTSGLQRRPSDLIGFILSVLWTIGTVTGFVCLGFLATNHLDESLARETAFTTADTA